MHSSVASYVGAPPFDSFQPIPELNRTDADVTLWILRNRAIYTGQVHDPLFQATTPWSVGTLQFYKPDSTITALACTEQYSFCNSANCTTLDALKPITKDLVQELLQYNPTQLATFDVVWRWLWSMRVFYQIFILDEDFLLASRQTFGVLRTSVNLPENQWQLEVGNLFNVSLAMLQLAGLIYVSPPPALYVTLNDTYDRHIFPPSTTEGKALCKTQKILSDGQYSFNLLALVLILVGGSIVIVLSHLVPSIVERWQARSSNEASQYRRREWDANDVLSLQSILLEKKEIGPWKDGNVPVPTETATKFTLPWLLESTEKDGLSTESDISIEMQD